MAAFVPPGAPRPRNDNASPQPPSSYNPTYQRSTDSLADNFQNLNVNQPPSSMPNHGPGQSPFGQPSAFPSAPSAGSPVPSRPFSRPGPPPAAFSRPGMPSSGASQAPVRPTGPPIGQPPPFSSRPPPATLASSMVANAPPTAGTHPSGSFPSSGLSSGFIAPPPPMGARPNPPMSSTLTNGPMPPPTAPGAVSNGPPAYFSGDLLSAPRFPSAVRGPQQLSGTPPTVVSAQSSAQAPSMHSLLGRPAFSAPPGPPGQQPLHYSTQGGPPPPQTSPYGSQTWRAHSGPMAPPSSIPGSALPPGMYGMQRPFPDQSMTSIPPAIGQAGAPVIGSSKIDPNQIPRPIPSSSIMMHETRSGDQANPPPPATSDYIVRDTGNCSPRYMRCTISQIPCTAELLTSSGMQLALLVQPLALPHPSEEPIQVVDFGDSGPVRCSRCKAYINPFMKFINQGRQFICNFCGFTDETPHDYHCNLGPDGRRRDADERPELCRGTVELVASKEFLVRDPMPAVYFFLIDVSMNAIQTGATAAACGAVSQVISDLPEGPRTFVGVATFDSTIHFYNLKRASQQPLMLIVPDVQDVYTPLQTDVIVQLSECRQHLELLLDSIPTMFQSNRTAESAFGAAIKAAFLAMKDTGGKLLVFQSVLPSMGIGALSAREAEGRANISAGEKEAQKLLQAADKTLKTMAIEFAEYQVCIDVFITTQTYIDIASISVLSQTTGGQVYYYHPFSAVSDSAKLYNDLRWNVTRPQGFEAVMRVRCSQGIQVDDYHGNYCKRIPTDVDLPAIDCDKTMMVTLKHDDKLVDGSECAFQCALLYTTVYGQRRIRVTTLSLPCTNTLNNLFRAADLETQFTCFLKQAASKIPSTPLMQVREQVTNLCVSLLLSYRRFCSTVSSAGQLILPDALKLLPLYTLALIKSSGLRTGGRIDDRSFWVNYVSSVSTPLAIPLVYPRMVAISLDSEDEDGSIVPPVIPLSKEHVNEERIYLLENGQDCLIYIGNMVASDILQKLLGISLVDEIPTQFVLQQYDNPLSKKFNKLMNEIRRQRCSYLRTTLCKKGDPSGEMFESCLVEDQNPNGPAYVDFLVQVHKQIQLKMSST